MAGEQRPMRIRELARATGVSTQTIHYYLREGLLRPPLKPAPNMALYGTEYLDEIRVIKELQERHYLPLSVIKLVLEARREGKDVSQLQDMRLSLEELFRPVGLEKELEPLAPTEMVAATGLAIGTLEQLEEVGVLIPSTTPKGKRYNGLDLHIARLVKKLLDVGLVPSDLVYYHLYVQALRAEARVVHDRLLRSPGKGARISGKELKETLDDIRASLTVQVQRKVVTELHDPIWTEEARSEHERREG